MTARTPSRRTVLGGLVATALTAPVPAFAGAGVPRIVALDWVSAASLATLGVMPVAAPELPRYGQIVVEPALAPGVQELGLRAEPNLERIARLRPDAILTDGELAPLEARLNRIAPVHRFQPHAFDGRDQIATGMAALDGLGRTVGLERQVNDYLARAQAAFDGAARLPAIDRRPAYVISLIDGRRCLVFTADGLFQAVLDRLGIANAWTGTGSAFGHLTVTLDQLAARPEARLINIGHVPLVRAALAMRQPVLSSLPAIRAGRVTLLPEVLFYGGIPAALRFLHLLTDALQAEHAA